MAYNPLHKLNDNLAALRIALLGDTPSQSEAAVLKTYSGFGGIKAVLYGEGTKEQWRAAGATEADLRLHEGIQQLHTLISDRFSEEEAKAIFSSLKHSVLTAFYTPAVIPQSLYGALRQHAAEPKHLYEPSAGAGVFFTEGITAFPSIQQITAVEKDLLTGSILQALANTLSVATDVRVKGFEETPNTENGKADLIVSNIPFGNFSVHDERYPTAALSGKIHNYFFAKGLDKLRDGGLLAYITTDAFLNSPSNAEARRYLFTQADFVSVAVMPDNLMKETGGTEAPSHLLIVQKNSTKSELSDDEELLLQTVPAHNEFGAYTVNAYLLSHPERICGNEIRAGKNQYGKAHQTVWQTGDIAAIGEPLSRLLQRDLNARFNGEWFTLPEQATSPQLSPNDKSLTFLPPPENSGGGEGAQLGLFDALGADAVNWAFAYLTKEDEGAIQRHTARVAAVTRTEEKGGHESLLLLTAKAKSSSFYVYKLYSNLREVDVPGHWVNAHALQHSLQRIGETLKDYPYTFRFEGESFFEASFGLTKQPYVQDIPAFYKEGTLVLHDGKIGTVSKLNGEKGALFQPFSANGKGEAFYKQYIGLRDSYFALSLKESESEIADVPLRAELNERYQTFTAAYGVLNQPGNRNALLNDALGFITLSSLERKEGEGWTKADIFEGPLFKQKDFFSTDDPVEALTHCLNERGAVDISLISRTTNLSEERTLTALERHIYLNPVSGHWQTADQYLSGNVVLKLAQSKEAAVLKPEDAQLRRSLEAVAAVQPEKIPFEILVSSQVKIVG